MDNDNRDGRALRHEPDGASAKQSDEGPDRKRDEKLADRQDERHEDAFNDAFLLLPSACLWRPSPSGSAKCPRSPNRGNLLANESWTCSPKWRAPRVPSAAPASPFCLVIGSASPW